MIEIEKAPLRIFATALALTASLATGVSAAPTATPKDRTVTVVRGDFPYTRTERVHLLSGAPPVVRHDHDMRMVPCLTPGETVRVQLGT